MNILRRAIELDDMTNAFALMKMGRLTENDRLLIYNVRNFMSKLSLWKENGAKTFLLDPELLDAFRFTDVSFDMFPSDFHYPFDSFMVQCLDEPLFMTDTPHGPSGVYAIFYLFSKMVYESGNVVIRTVKGERRDRLEWDRSLSGIFSGPDGRGLESINLNLRDDCSIEHALSHETDSSMGPLDDADKRNLVNLFFNTLLYVSDSTRDRTATESRGVKRFKTGKGDAEKYEQEYILLKPPSGLRLRHDGDPRSPMDKRFIVRGHWRDQACGENFSLRRKIWIKPFWKGPEMSEIVMRPYLVKP